MLDLFDTSDFPARWRCGNWSPGLGWLHILSDLLIWGAYLAIPIVLVYFTRRRRDIPFQGIFLLFGAFIVACGTTHLIEAIIFYEPIYRLAGVVKAFTALVSWATVLALFRVVPQALTMKTPGQLEAEVAARVAELKAANEALEASEARFRHLTEAMPQIVWTAAADGRTTYLNSRWTVYTGLAAAGPEAAARVIHPDDRGPMTATWQEARRTGSVFQAEFRLQPAAGGAYHWFLARAVPVRGPRGEVREWLGTSTDVDDLKRTEAALRESQRHFRELTESLPQLVWTDRPDGYCDYLSPQWVRYTGIPAADQLGYGWADQLHPDDRARATAAWERTVAAGTDFEVEFRIRRADGVYRWFQTRAVPLRDEAGAVVKWFGTNTDIDDRKRVEAALRDSREMLQLVLDNIPQGVVWKDRDSRYLGCNAVVARAVGLADPATIVGRTDADLPGITPDQAAFFVQKDRAVMTADAPEAHIIEPMTLSDGRTIWLDTTKVPLHDQDGRVIGLLATWEDITDRRWAEEALRVSESRFRGAFENTNVAMVLTDPDNRFIRANAAFARMFGYTQGELVGMTLADVTHPAHLAESYANREPLVAGTADYFEMEKRYVHKAGHELWGRTNVSVVRDAGGRPLLYVGQVQDITERQAAEEEVRRLTAELEARVRARTAELEAANKELEAFSYSVSHDLRAPLRAIDGFSRILLRDYAPALPSDAQEFLADVRRNAQQMGRLVDDLLAFSRLGRQALRVQRVDMAGLVRECLDELNPPASAEVRVADLPAAAGDRALLKQVWLNLLSNALKYAGKREPTVVEVGADGPAYFVRDNGVGFDMRYAKKLFGVFQRLHRAEDYEGTGVGLAIVQRIVHRHGGRVWAESEPNHGATFFFTVGPGPAAAGLE